MRTDSFSPLRRRLVSSSLHESSRTYPVPSDREIPRTTSCEAASNELRSSEFELRSSEHEPRSGEGT